MFVELPADLDSREAQEQLDELARVPRHEVDRLELSLAQVARLGEAGLGALLRVQSHLSWHRKPLLLVDACAAVRQSLRAMGLHGLLPAELEPATPAPPRADD
jgi:anti-anti-sigma regulatory factor